MLPEEQAEPVDTAIPSISSPTRIPSPSIKSNEKSILLFEEPEANCYPPHIKALAQDIIDATTNQFFIATHSDCLLYTSPSPRDRTRSRMTSSA